MDVEARKMKSDLFYVFEGPVAEMLEAKMKYRRDYQIPNRAHGEMNWSK